MTHPDQITDREIAEGVERIKARQRKASARLANTEGLRTGAWSSGRYHVTYNGEPIGSVHAATKSWSGSTGKAKLSNWIPSSASWHIEPLLPEGQRPCKTLSEAAAVVLDAWHRKQEKTS